MEKLRSLVKCNENYTKYDSSKKSNLTISWVVKPGVTHQCMIFISAKKKHEESPITAHFPQFHWGSLFLVFPLLLREWYWNCSFPLLLHFHEHILHQPNCHYSTYLIIPSFPVSISAGPHKQSWMYPHRTVSSPSTRHLVLKLLHHGVFPSHVFLKGERRRNIKKLYSWLAILHFCRQ